MNRAFAKLEEERTAFTIYRKRAAFSDNVLGYSVLRGSVQKALAPAWGLSFEWTVLVAVISPLL